MSRRPIRPSTISLDPAGTSLWRDVGLSRRVLMIAVTPKQRYLSACDYAPTNEPTDSRPSRWAASGTAHTVSARALRLAVRSLADPLPLCPDLDTFASLFAFAS